MSDRVWSSEERRVALERVSAEISARASKMREQRHGIAVEACEEFQAMQVAIELQCRLTDLKQTFEASERLRTHEYMAFGWAGGPKECDHGIAAGIHCRKCDQKMVDGAMPQKVFISPAEARHIESRQLHRSEIAQVLAIKEPL
jgi:hypothetical protein